MCMGKFLFQVGEDALGPLLCPGHDIEDPSRAEQLFSLGNETEYFILSSPDGGVHGDDVKGSLHTGGRAAYDSGILSPVQHTILSCQPACSLINIKEDCILAQKRERDPNYSISTSHIQEPVLRSDLNTLCEEFGPVIYSLFGEHSPAGLELQVVTPYPFGDLSDFFFRCGPVGEVMFHIQKGSEIFINPC